MTEPCAPAALDAHAREYLRHAECDAADREREDQRGQMKHGCGVALLDRIEDRAIPDIDAILEADRADDEEDEPDGERPCQPVAALAPIAARADPEPRQEIALARLFGFLGRELRIGLDDFGRRRLDMVTVLSDDIDDRRFLRVVGWLLGRVMLRGVFGHGTTTRRKSDGPRGAAHTIGATLRTPGSPHAGNAPRPR